MSVSNALCWYQSKLYEVIDFMFGIECSKILKNIMLCFILVANAVLLMAVASLLVNETLCMFNKSEKPLSVPVDFHYNR